MVTVLDGGMGGELARRGASTVTGLWSAQALLEAPEMVKAVHADYVRAGARIITTNTYSTVPSYLAKGALQDRYVELTELGAQLARSVADEVSEDVLVAGSVPPLSESYRPDLVPAAAEAKPIYRQIVTALAPTVDLFLCETMSSADEARTAASAAAEHGGGKPIYVAWTLDESAGQGLRSGETVAQAVAALDGLPIAALLFNCTRPEAILAALQTLRELTDLPIGGYANRLDRIPPGWTLDNELPSGRNRDLSQAVFVDTALQFVDAGATLVGGCCGIGPEDIAAFANALD